MRISAGVEMLEITSTIMGRPNTIYPTLLWDDETVILVDTGFPGQLPNFQEAIEKTGIPFTKLNRIILTHHDIDHIGSLASIQKKLPGSIEVLAYLTEKEYIEGHKIPLKLAKLEVNLDKSPDEQKAVYKLLKSGFQNSFAHIDGTLIDGEELPYCGGITVIFTPGHTLGHICLYLSQSKMLIAGDALAVEQGELVVTPHSSTFDVDLYYTSLQKIAARDVDSVICYHGGFYKGDIHQRLITLLSER